MLPQKYNISFIINPIAGKRKAKNVSEDILSNIDNKRFNPSVHITEYQGHAVCLARKLKEENIDIIVAVGGDGTVNEIAGEIVNTNIILGLISLGGGNGLSNFLKIPHNIQKCIEIINEFNTKLIDTGLLNDNLFVSVAGVGFDAAVIRTYSKYKSRGIEAYMKAIVSQYINYKPQKYKVIINNKIIEKQALLISIANSNQFGYHATISPRAVIDDGKLNLNIVTKVPLLMAPLTVPLLFTDKIDYSKYYETYEIEEATIITKNPTLAQIDGEPVELKDNVVKVKVNKKSLRVIVPCNKKTQN